MAPRAGVVPGGSGAMLTHDRRRTRVASYAAVVCLVAGLGFAYRTDLGVLLALHVTPITSRTIDQHIGFATTSDGVRIAYATSGAGPPLVMTLGWFTHLTKGLFSPSYDNAGQLGWFSRDHLVVRYDGRGFGLSDHNVTDFSLEARVRDLEAVVDALHLERFALDGFSAGGPTAVTYAARHPERVTRMVLLGTFMNDSFLKSVDPIWIERYAASGRMWAFARTDWEKPAARAAMVEWVHPKANEIERRVLMELYRVSADGPTFANFAAVVPDASESARQIRIPTLVVAGTEDTELPVEAGSQVAAAIPGARFELLDGADHFETIGHDARVLQMVSSFLRGNALTRPAGDHPAVWMRGMFAHARLSVRSLPALSSARRVRPSARARRFRARLPTGDSGRCRAAPASASCTCGRIRG